MTNQIFTKDVRFIVFGAYHSVLAIGVLLILLAIRCRA